jgi:hypothetical protein
VTRRRAYELQGDLHAFPPALLFQMMALGNLDGLLRLRSLEGTCDVFFQRGKLVFARGPARREPLGDELVRRGLLERAACEAAARERERHPNGPRIGAILVKRGHIDREALETAIRERIKESIYSVVDWREGRFTFEAKVHPEDEDVLLDVQLESLLLECMTRLDEGRRGAGGGRV